MYKWQVHTHADENGYARVIGFLVTEILDCGEATEMAKFMADAGEFDNRNYQYSADDVFRVYPTNR